VLAVEDVTKSFGHVSALRGVTCEILPGEVVALVGDNGAGKSTLMKVMCGDLTPDAGRVLVEGEDVTGRSHATADHGVGVVYQDLALAPDLRAYENFFLGNELGARGLAGRLGLLDRRAMATQCRASLDDLGITTLASVHDRVGAMSGGQRQCIAIARAVNWATTAVVMDEPTAALGVQQTELVGRMIEEISASGIAVLLISHDMPQVIEMADRILVMRHGSLVADIDSSGATVAGIVEAMLGAHGAVR
jgi:ABC-type sugar transport system ATPase subunit